MKIVKKTLEPSRDDAVRITRDEKMSMLVLAYAATILEDIRTELADRIRMIEDGEERTVHLSEETDRLLHDLRMTIPMNQRLNLQNTASDYEVRLTPKATPTQTNIVMQKDEFRELVDFARTRCVDCMENDEDCEKCGLYQLLTVLLPVDGYHNGMFCPYNMGEWAN